MRRPRLLSRSGPRSRSAIARSMPRPTAGGSGISTILEPLPTTRRTRWPCSSPISAMSVLQASKIRSPSMSSITTSAKSNGLAESRAAESSTSNCRCERPSVGDSFDTRGRRTYSAGECSRTHRSGRTQSPPPCAGRRWRACTCLPASSRRSVRSRPGSSLAGGLRVRRTKRNTGAGPRCSGCERIRRTGRGRPLRPAATRGRHRRRRRRCQLKYSCTTMRPQARLPESITGG